MTDSEVPTVEALDGVLVEYTSVSVETLAAGDVAPHSVKYYCTCSIDICDYI